MKSTDIIAVKSLVCEAQACLLELNDDKNNTTRLALSYMDDVINKLDQRLGQCVYKSRTRGD